MTGSWPACPTVLVWLCCAWYSSIVVDVEYVCLFPNLEGCCFLVTVYQTSCTGWFARGSVHGVADVLPVPGASMESPAACSSGLLVLFFGSVATRSDLSLLCWVLIAGLEPFPALFAPCLPTCVHPSCVSSSGGSVFMTGGRCCKTALSLAWGCSFRDICSNSHLPLASLMLGVACSPPSLLVAGASWFWRLNSSGVVM